MFPSKISPDSAVTTGLLTAVGVYLIYNQAMPSTTDLRTVPPHDADAESARKGAAVKSAALLGLVFVVAHDINAFIIGGAALFGIDFMYKHANAVHPMTGKMDTSTNADSIAPGLAVATPLPDYNSEAS